MTTVQEIPSQKAWEILQEEPSAAVLIDVRSRMEYDYVGHPVGALHVPWMEAPEWNVDPAAFTDTVRAGLRQRCPEPPETLTLLLMCRSGARSRAAAVELAARGFQTLYNIEDGFEGDLDHRRHRSTVNGWRFHKLPWEQS